MDIQSILLPLELDEISVTALDTILRADIALDRYKIQTHELHDRIKNHSNNVSSIKLPEVEEETRNWLEIIYNAELAGLLNHEIRFMQRSFAVERVFELRWIEGYYDESFREISSLMEIIETREGLSEDHFWLKGQEPEDYRWLQEKYSLIWDRRFEDTLREFELNEMADLHQNERAGYYTLRENGREIIHDPPAELEFLQTIRKKFESEAERCAESKCYHAATIMIGSAIEAALLYTCLKSSNEAQSARKRLPDKERPSSNPKRWRLVDLALVAEEAGWLPNYKIEGIEFLNTASLIKKIQLLRNLVHPGRHLREKNAIDVEGSLEVAKASYVLLFRILEQIRTE